MFEVSVEVEFSAAHHIEGYPGDCARPHGHNWKLIAKVQTHELDQLGMAVDFRQLKKACNEIIAPWDHQDLNTLADFEGIQPTAEQVARLAFQKVKTQLEPRQKLVQVSIWENARCSATYFEADDE